MSRESKRVPGLWLLVMMMNRLKHCAEKIFSSRLLADVSTAEVYCGSRISSICHFRECSLLVQRHVTVFGIDKHFCFLRGSCFTKFSLFVLRMFVSNGHVKVFIFFLNILLIPHYGIS